MVSLFFMGGGDDIQKKNNTRVSTNKQNKYFLDRVGFLFYQLRLLRLWRSSRFLDRPFDHRNAGEILTTGIIYDEILIKYINNTLFLKSL